MLQYIVKKISNNTTKLEYFYRYNKIGYVSFYNPINNSKAISRNIIIKNICRSKFRSNNFEVKF